MIHRRRLANVGRSEKRCQIYRLAGWLAAKLACLASSQPVDLRYAAARMQIRAKLRVCQRPACSASFRLRLAVVWRQLTTSLPARISVSVRVCEIQLA